MARPAAQVAQRCQQAQESEQLDLSDCELTTFPEGAIMLTQQAKILSLNISNNLLTSLSAKIPNKWLHLQSLDISHNTMFSLPQELGNLNQLKSLVMSHNSFNHIPLVVYTLPLEILKANNNKIEEIAAEELKSMSRLKHVDLKENLLADEVKEQLMEREDWKLAV